MLLSLLMLACGGQPDVSPASPPPEQAATKIRVGWQTTWATQGQLAVILQKTDILERHGFDASFHGFSYGGPLNEGALAGEVDVLFTADQPAIALMSKAADWRTIGRLMYNRVGTFVPPDSPVQSPADLKGKTVAIPFGAAAHRETLGALAAAGLDPKKDVKVVNLGLNELIALVGRGAEGGRWGDIDAGSAWDPAYANMEHSGQIRAIASGIVTSVVVMDTDLSAADPGADHRFMEAMLEAYGYYQAHPQQANEWFKQTSKLPFDLAVLDLAASVEPNLRAGAALSVELSQDDIGNMQAAADFMVEAGLLREPVQVAPLIVSSAAADLPAPELSAIQQKP